MEARAADCIVRDVGNVGSQRMHDRTHDADRPQSRFGSYSCYRNSPHVRAATGQQINFRRPSIQHATDERQTRYPVQVHFSFGLP